jgi:SAM-dependent methyltransferase
MFINEQNIKILFSKIDPTSEFEIMFNNYKSDNKLSIIKFMNLLNIIKYRAIKEDLKIEKDVSLDILYNYNNNDNYRITIVELDRINKILNLIHQRKNNVIFSILITQFSNSEGFSFINKIKNPNNIIDLDQYNIRIRSSNEIPLDKKILNSLSNLQFTESEKILFRYKQRISLILKDDPIYGKLKLDLSIIKSNSNPNELYNTPKQFEVELEYTTHNEPNIDILSDINNEIIIIKKILDNSNILLSKDENINIISIYKKILYGLESYALNNLYSMQPISTEVQHIVDKIPNKYSVTDKADGDKFQLLVFNKVLYLLSNNLVVQKINKSSININTTIIEGELINYNNNNLFLMYDCLYYDGKDIRNESLLINRLKYIYDFCDLLNIKYHKIEQYDKEFNISLIEKYYENNIINYYNTLNNTIKNSKEDIICSPKIFFFPLGGNNSEVFLYSKLLWNACTNHPLINCPYLLDGIIYTGLEQKYVREKREQKYPIYKYKPPEKNSIDIYITFQRNIELGGFLEVYDNSINNLNTNKIFRIANFYVYDVINDKEVPVPFMKEENNHEAFFQLDREEVRDVEGNLISDNTVVEVIYVNDPAIPHQYRWKILKTRWDKTELVLRENKRYGNFKDSAIKIWKSIRESVSINEIKQLANPDTYIYQNKLLSQRIDYKVISSERAQDMYYQKTTNLGEKFREFHNWIKSSLIYTYCVANKENINGKIKRKSVLDIGCGRGGDIMKMYHARVQEYVGIDNDYEGLFGALDSALIRYQQNMSKYPDFNKVILIQADATIPLISNLQEKKLTNMTLENKKLIDTVFNKEKKYDIINMQFSIHYLFDSQVSVNNLINIISTYLKLDGFLICTLFDPSRVMNLLNNKDVFTSYYTDDNGQKNKFFEIIKKFEGDYEDKVNQPIDVFMAWLDQEGKYKTEFLISHNLLINTMEKAKCVLIESDSFENIYNINKEWFYNVIDHEENIKNKKFYKNVAQFYGDLKGVDKESLTWNKLIKYYIFKKI